MVQPWAQPARTVDAHAYYFKSEPPREEVLATAPTAVRVWFSEDVDPANSGLAVVDAVGNRVDLGDCRRAPDDTTLLVIGLQPIGAGVYTVQWHTVSTDDGHEAQNEFRFTVTS